MGDNNITVSEGDPQFEKIRSSVKSLLEALQASGFPMGSCTRLSPVEGLCLIVATGDMAGVWSDLYEEVEVHLESEVDDVDLDDIEDFDPDELTSNLDFGKLTLEDD